MKVKELIEILSKYDGDLKVVNLEGTGCIDSEYTDIDKNWIGKIKLDSEEEAIVLNREVFEYEA
jgi:hypothetical protein